MAGATEEMVLCFFSHDGKSFKGETLVSFTDLKNSEFVLSYRTLSSLILERYRSVRTVTSLRRGGC